MTKIKKKRRVQIAFFGDGEIKKTNPTFVDAYDTAQLLAKHKYVIVNGGGPGVMLASTLGAVSVSGRVKVIVIENGHQPPKHYEGQHPENIANAQKIIPLKSYSGRLRKIINMGDAYVIFYGGTGTLAEMTYVWSEAKFAYPKSKPIIFYGRKWRKIIHTITSELNFEKIEKQICYFADKPEHILEIIKTYSKVK